MPIKDIDHLSDHSSVWIFGITPALGNPDHVLRLVDTFHRSWEAHGTPVTSGREIREGRFLVVAAEKSSEKSGCSIDRMFGLIREIERNFEVAMLDANRVYFRDAAGVITDVARADFGQVGAPDTVVFDTTVTTLGEVRNGSWEKPASQSWHSALLRQSA